MTDHDMVQSVLLECLIDALELNILCRIKSGGEI
jgi:hypothetical protein